MSSRNTRSNRNQSNANNASQPTNSGVGSSTSSNTVTTQPSTPPTNHEDTPVTGGVGAQVPVTTNIMSPQQIKPLKALTYSNILITKDFFRSSGYSHLELKNWMNPNIEFNITQKLKSLKIEGWEDWRNKDKLEWLFPNLEAAYPANADSTSTSPIDRLSGLKQLLADIDASEESTLHAMTIAFSEVFNMAAALAYQGAELTNFLRKVYDVMKEAGKSNPQAKSIYEDVQNIEAPTTLPEFLEANCKVFFEKRENALKTRAHFGCTTASLFALAKKRPFDRTSVRATGNNQTAPAGNNLPTTSNAPSVTTECNGCGRKHRQDCILKNHPNRNTENVPWVQSTNGKAFARKLNRPVPVLPWEETLSGQGWNHPEKPPKRENTGGATPYNKRRKCNNKCLSCVNDEQYICTVIQKKLTNNTNMYTIPVIIQQGVEPITARALVDTGALHANYINKEAVERLTRVGAVVDDSTHIVNPKTKIATYRTLS